MFNISAKLQALDQIYGIYDRFVEDLKRACEKSCSSCCTCNVTLTTLVGYWIIDHLIRSEGSDRLEQVARYPDTERFHPKMTTNMLAERCAEDGEIPEEPMDPRWGTCVFLGADLCAVYRFRPFGCRCMLSRINCRDTGAADMDDFVVSVNTLFLQTIEHIDADGYSGNLVDILRLMAGETHRTDYACGSLSVSGLRLIRNRPMKKLFVPPEHRVRIQPILRSLQAIRA